MNVNELDSFLRSFTEKEIKYIENKPKSNFYSSREQTIINNKNVYVFFTEALNIKKFFISRHPRFTETKEHIHSYIELNYMYSGSCTQYVNDKEIHLTKGQFILLDTNVPHSIDIAGKDDIMINVELDKRYFDTSFLSRLSKKGIISNFLANSVLRDSKHDNYILFLSEEDMELPNIMINLMREFFDPKDFSDEIIDSYISLLFIQLMRVYKYHINNRSLKTLHNNSIIDILQYLEDNYMNTTLNSTAKFFNYNPTYLSTMLHKATGSSFKQLIQTQKMTRAKFLITNSNMPIDDIAHDIGYNNLSFFYKKFFEFYGVKPSEYRKV